MEGRLGFANPGVDLVRGLLGGTQNVSLKIAGQQDGEGHMKSSDIVHIRIVVERF